jgi:ribosome-binding protein aMBF1 (putative translation factor)
MLNSKSNNDQDWVPVVFKKKAPPKKQIHIDPTFKKMKQLEDSDIPIQIKTVSAEDKKIIETLRIQKKLSQVQLNVKLSLKKDTIKDIESGIFSKNNQITNKIKKFLIDYKPPLPPTSSAK